MVYNKSYMARSKRDKLPKGVLIDDQDRELINSFNNWYISLRGDVVSTYQKTINGVKTYKSYKLHRVIMRVTDPRLTVDHKNRNPLDNHRKEF